MSEAVGIKIHIKPDSQEAEKKLENLDKRLDRIKEKSRETKNAIDGHSNTISGSNHSSPAAAINSRATNQRQLSPKESGTIIGKSAGSIIGSAITGYFGEKALRIGFEAARTHGGDNTIVNRAEKSVTGAGGGAMAGWMLGGPIGAAIGAVVGGGLGMAEALQEERRNKYQSELARWHSDLSAVQGAAANIGGGALAQLLSIAGSKEDRSQILMDSIRDTNKRRRKVRGELDNVRDTSSIRHQYLSSEEARLANLEMGLWSQLATNKTQLNMPMIAGQEVTDAFAKRGLYTGGQIDITSVNADTRASQQEMIGLLKEMVEVMREGSWANGQNLNELLMKLQKVGTL